MNLYAPGALIAGQYEVAGQPLMGGMGIVYLCLDHSKGGHPVALKTFKPEYLPDLSARDRFLREGTTWVNLGSHSHIVRCYEVLRVGDGTEVYLVLELVTKEQGRQDASLRSCLIRGKPLPVDQALLFALQIARGMKHATEVIPAFVHRDLKPENVLVGADRLSNADVNRVRVTDFGLASVLQELGGQPAIVCEDLAQSGNAPLSRTHLTRGVVGTPLYMAPEQWRVEPVSVATDVYALGCMLVEMLTGQPAVQGNSVSDLQEGHRAGKALAMAEVLGECQQELLRKCLVLKPEGRLSDWAGVEAALIGAYTQSCGKAAPEPEAPRALERAERVAVGWSYSNIGISYVDLGKADVARGYFEQAIRVGQIEGDRDLEGAGIGHLASAYDDLGDISRAIGYCEQALATNREIGDRRGEGVALDNLGGAYRHLGDARRGIVYIEQALAIFRELGDQDIQGNELGNLGAAYADLGDVGRAIGYYEQALTVHREIGNQRGEGNDLGNLGNAFTHLGEVRRAIGYYEQALTIHHAIGNQRSEGVILGSLGSAYRELGNARRAIEYFEPALAIAHETGNRRSQAINLGNLGNAYLQLGDAKRAIGLHEQALAIDREIGDQHGEGRDLGGLGSAYLQLGEARQAIGYFEQALVIAREIGDQRGEEIHLGNLGNAYGQLGEVHLAIRYFEQALTLDREIGDVMAAAIDSYNLALLYAKQGEVARALPLARQAAQFYTQLGHAEYSQRAQQLVTQLQSRDSNSNADDPTRRAFEAFLGSISVTDIEHAVAQYPFMIEPGFIRAIEQVTASQVPTQRKLAFEERLGWLRRIAQEHKP